MQMKWIYIGVITLSVILWVMFFSKPVVKYFANKQLINQQLIIDVKKLHLNPFLLSVDAEGFQVFHQDKPVLSLEKIRINIGFWALISKQIQLEEFVVDGVSLSSEWHEQGLSFSGWSPKDNEAIDISPSSEKGEMPNDQQALKLHANQLILDNLLITLQAEQSFNWQIEQLHVFDINVANENLEASIVLVSRLNSKPINISLRYTQTSASTVIDIEQSEFGVELSEMAQWLPRELGLKGELGLNFKGVINNENTTWHVSQSSLTASAEELAAILPIAQAKSELSIADISVQTEISALSYDVEKNNLDGQLNIAVDIQSIDWLMVESDDLLAKIESVSAPNLEVLWQPALKLKANSLVVNNGLISQRSRLPTVILEEGKPAALVDFKQLTLSNLESSVRHLALDNVTLDLTQANVYKSKEIAAENWILSSVKETTTKKEEKQGSTDAAEQTTKEPKFDIKIEKLSVTGEPEFTLFDYSPSEPVVQKVTGIHFEINDLNSTQPKNNSTMRLSGKIGKRGEMLIEGDIYPFTEFTDLNVTGHLNSINLAPYSPYVMEAINHRITQGQMSADFKFALVDQIIDGNVDTEIKAMALAEEESIETNNSGNTVIPLNVAINQLTDEKGNIKLSFPLSDHIDEPRLGVSGLVSIIATKALKEGAKNYLIQTFLPYANIISVAMMASDTLFEVSIQDLVYASNQVDLQDEQRAFAAQLAAVLQERSNAQLVICPVVTNEESSLLAGENEEVKKSRKALQALGQQRLDLFTDYLIEQHNLSVNRIIHCDTRIDDGEGAIPRLTFTAK